MKRLLCLMGTLTFVLILTSTLTFAQQSVAPGAMMPKSSPAVKAQLVDINTATEAELKAVPGIGDSYSKKIIAGRPYVNKDQLKTKKIIPARVYEKIKGLIIAPQPKK